SAAKICSFGLIVGPYWESSSITAELTQAYPQLSEHIVLRTDHRNAFVTLAMAGAGAAFVGAAQAENARRRGAVVVSISPRIERKISVSHRPDYLAPAAEEFINIAERLGKD